MLLYTLPYGKLVAIANGTLYGGAQNSVVKFAPDEILYSHTWNKYTVTNTTVYTWNVHSINTKTTYVDSELTLSPSPPWFNTPVDEYSVIAGSNYTFDANTGKYILSGANVRTYEYPGYPTEHWLLADTYRMITERPYFSTKLLNEPSTYVLWVELYGSSTGEFQRDKYIMRGRVASTSTEQSKGDRIRTASSVSSNTYPSDGISGSYWYVATGSHIEQSMGSFIETVYSANASDYPTNGYQNGYWYVKVS